MTRIDTLCFELAPAAAGQPGLHVTRRVLALDRASDLLRLCEDATRPALYLADAACWADLSRLRPVVEDCRAQHASKALSEYLAGRGGLVPVLRGCYVEAGRLRQGIRAFLERAQGLEREEESWVYVLLERSDLVHELAQDAAPPGASDHLGEGAGTEGVRLDAGKAAFEAETLPLWSIVERRRPAAFPEACDLERTLIEQFRHASAPARLAVRQTLFAAASRETVLILGETGTGKEILAQAIARGRSDRPAIGCFTCNCAAIPTELLETELFGSVKGAYTGAQDRMGILERAHNGAVILDEIGELSPLHQAKILRFLENGEVRRVGAAEAKQCDVRVIASTNRDLWGMARQGTFREDLYWRLAQIKIRMPPLRYYPEDARQVVEALWTGLAGEKGPPLPGAAMDLLTRQPWPGNAREVKAVLGQLHAYCVEEVREVAVLERRMRRTEDDGGAARERWLLAQDELLGHLRSILAYLGRGLPGPADDRGERTRRRHLHERHEHLGRAIDVLRACKKALRPLKHDHDRPDDKVVSGVARELRQRIRELDALCSHPLRFHTREAYDLCYAVKQQLWHLHQWDLTRRGDGESAEGRGDAVVRWAADGVPLYERAVAALFEADRAVSEAM